MRGEPTAMRCRRSSRSCANASPKRARAAPSARANGTPRPGSSCRASASSGFSIRGAGVYFRARSEETFTVRERERIFMGAPPLVKAATGVDVSAEELGGADVHTRVSGVADHLALDDAHAIKIARDIVALLERR